MVLLNMYGKIQPTIISKKLGIGICNLASDWVDKLQADFEKEILIHKHFIATSQRNGHDVSWATGRYNLENIVKQLGWQEEGTNAIQIIAEHLIEIQISDFDNSLLRMKNEHLDSPTCEPQYTRKFLIFCSKIQSSKSGNVIIPKRIPQSTYNSDDLFVQPLIINYLEARLGSQPSQEIAVGEHLEMGVESLKCVGALIDNFLCKDNDFWLFDYILNAIYDDQEYSAYHIFKVMSLIEMLIINPEGKGKTKGEMEQKLPYFLSNHIPPEKGALFAEIIRKLRNKIGHGDFQAVQQLLEQYRQSFMENFWFDEVEHSIENWTYSNICMFLDEALNEILWLLLYEKEQLLQLKKS